MNVRSSAGEDLAIGDAYCPTFQGLVSREEVDAFSGIGHDPVLAGPYRAEPIPPIRIGGCTRMDVALVEPVGGNGHRLAPNDRHALWVDDATDNPPARRHPQGELQLVSRLGMEGFGNCVGPPSRSDLQIAPPKALGISRAEPIGSAPTGMHISFVVPVSAGLPTPTWKEVTPEILVKNCVDAKYFTP